MPADLPTAPIPSVLFLSHSLPQLNILIKNFSLPGTTYHQG